MALPYAIREGLSGFRRAAFASAASTGAMAVALVLVSVVFALGIEAQQVASWLRQRVGEIEVFLDDVDDRAGQGVHDRIKAQPGVDVTQYISRAEAAEIFRQEFGEGAEAFFDAPFLPASVRFTVTSGYANPDSLSVIAAQVATWSNVDDVVFNQPLLVKVQKNLRLLTLGGSALAILVLLASIFLVANTIRLTIYARRLIIRTMKLVGATDGFIRLPFVIEGVLQGLIAGIVALGVLSGFYVLAVRTLPQLPPVGSDQLAIFGIAVLVGGMLLGWSGSAVSVRRFVRKVALH
ncbi:MAG: cell division transport system permease protein [Rhodothermales bacterium]|jgi:cell division transport system permease protein